MVPKKRLAILAVFAAFGTLVFGAPVVSAESNSVIEGETRGIELCPQFRCGSAVFTGRFLGSVGSVSDSNGRWSVAIQHDPLPAAGQSTALTGGLWSLDATGKTFKGFVEGGKLTNNGDDTFTIHATLRLTRGGSGTLTFEGLLDHRNIPFVPVFGTISQ